MLRPPISYLTSRRDAEYRGIAGELTSLLPFLSDVCMHISDGDAPGRPLKMLRFNEIRGERLYAAVAIQLRIRSLTPGHNFPNR